MAVVGVLLDVSRTATTNALQAALEKKLIEATTDSAHDPKRKYRLTANGKRQLNKGRHAT